MCVHQSIKRRADIDTKVQRSKQYLFSLLPVSVLTLLVFAGSPPAFDSVSTRKNGGRKMSEMSLHPIVTGQKSVSFFTTSSLLIHTRHLPVAQAGHHTSSVPADPGTGISVGAESQLLASSSSPPAPPSPSPPPAGGCTPLVSGIDI